MCHPAGREIPPDLRSQPDPNQIPTRSHDGSHDSTIVLSVCYIIFQFDDFPWLSMAFDPDLTYWDGIAGLPSEETVVGFLKELRPVPWWVEAQWQPQQPQS
jgi:hypothetical protein